jgi:hypothetical protein
VALRPALADGLPFGTSALAERFIVRPGALLERFAGKINAA